MQVSLRVRCCGTSAASSSQLLLCCRAYTTAPISRWSSISHTALPALPHAAQPLCTLRVHRHLSSAANLAAATSSAVYTAQRCFSSTAHLCAPRSGKRKTPSRRHSPTKKRLSHKSHEKPNSDASPYAAQHNEKTSDNSHYPNEKLSSFEAQMDGGDAQPSPNAGASSSVDGQEPAASVDLEPGWGLETVDKVTGKTALEDLYDRNLARIHRILEQPLPPIPQDGSVDPDFFVGFASYSYQLRDQYRAVIARELQVPVKAVRLSVGWSGRFNVKRFGRVQKVCGVCLDREELSGTENAEVVAAAAAAARVNEGTAPRALPDDVLHRITTLIAAINAQRREDLLQVQLFQASPPIPEVEFALTRQEHRLIFHLHDWLRRNVLRRAVAVVVCGLPPPLLPAESKDGEKAEKSALMERRFAEWQRQALSATAGQRREVETRWLRLFHRREIVPAIVTLTELATALAVAVVRGDVATVACVAGDEAGDEAAVQLHGALREVVVAIAAAASERSNVSDTLKSEADGGEDLSETPQATARSKLLTKVDMLLPSSASASIVAATAAAPTAAGAEDLFATTTQQESALRWVRLVYQALLLREMHSAGSAGIGAAASSTAAAGVPLNVSFPALFAHGVYAGSRDEVDYLQHNRAAMDALLLHPHEISFKKKFVGRMSSGHRRLKMEAEAAAPHADGG